MEPKILMIGWTLTVIDILIAELKPFGRDIMGANAQNTIQAIFACEKIDLVIIGASLPENTRSKMAHFIQSLAPNVAIHQIKKTESCSPYNLIEYTSQKAVEWKIEQKLGKRK